MVFVYSHTEMPYLLIFLLGLLIFSSEERLRCGQESLKENPRFYFAAACVRSKMTLIGASYSTSLQQCSQYAIRRGGLAVNYLNRHLLHPSKMNFSRETCLVFDCPEFDVQLSLEIDSFYDYYTTYARPMPNSNVTCIPRLGVFQLHREHLNFTQAYDVCEEDDSFLADVSTGPRSVQLAAVLRKERVKKAFIGLSTEEGKFVTSSEIPLECLPYRGWAPGEPRTGNKCATLTDRGLWVSQKCEYHLPFICELKPSGPLRPCNNLPEAWRKKCKEKFISSFPTSERWPKCGDPSVDENTYRLPLRQSKNHTTENDRNSNKNSNKTATNKKQRIPS